MTAKPRFVVCEDGREYLDRFQRFLGATFDLLPASDYATARAAAGPSGAGAAGILLDLDFRRTPPERLVDGDGPAPAGMDPGTRARLAETQGILILRRLRADGVRLPAILFADLDDAAQARFLTQTLAPLSIVSSRVGLPEIAALMRETSDSEP
jgi:hypothetical protein